MRRFFRLPNLLLFAFGIFLVNACTVDEDPFVLSPNVSFGTGVDFLDADATISGGTAIRVNLIATKGDNPMQTVEFLENSVQIADFDTRITIDGSPAISALPLLTGDDVDALSWDISITPHATGTSTYTFSVSDANGNSNQVSLEITIQNDPPTLSFPGSGTTLTTTPNTWDEKKVTVDAMGNTLSTISVWQDGALITDLTRISFGDFGTNFTNNPLDLTGDDVNGLTDKSVYIKSQNDGTSIYTIFVETLGGLTAQASYDIAIMATGTAIDATYTGVLLQNAASPNATGGMDVYTGNTVSVNSMDADVIDSGIDGNADWLQSIEPANGSAIRRLSATQIGDGFDFDAITFKEEIIEAWNGGDAIVDMGFVAVDDVFMIEKDDDYFVIKCTLIESTNGDNLDKYEFDIKQAIF